MKKTLLLWAALALLMLAFCVPSLADGLEAVTYLDWDSDSASLVERVQDEYTVLTGSSFNWNNGWYVANGSVTISRRVQAAGDVHLILLDGAELIVEGGIGVSNGGSLTIYACSTGDSMGWLRVHDTPDYCAGIGGNDAAVTICGGNITATGGALAAGIGSYSSGISTVNIYGGNITATGGKSGAGIGSSTVNIYGGSITATGGDSGAGISGSSGSSTVNIYGGSIKATGDDSGVGIGSGDHGDSTVNIYGGSIDADGGREGAGIGSGVYGDSTVNIYDGSIEADGSVDGAGIGSGHEGDSTVNIYGGMIFAKGGPMSAGIGSGDKGSSTVNIYGGSIEASDGGDSAGIGNGANSTCSVTIQLSSEKDSLSARSYHYRNQCTVTVQDCVLTDHAGNTYSGELSSAQLDAMAHKTLVLTPRYNATIAEGIPEGMVMVSSARPQAGATVTVSCPEGYRLDNLTVTDAAGNSVPVTDNTFIMPFSDVTVSAECVRVYDITLESNYGAGVTVPAKAAEGETVTVSAAAVFRLRDLTVTDAENHSVQVTDNTFVMPASDVTMSVQLSIKYLDWDSASASLVEREQDTYTVLTGSSVEWANGWYVADGSVTISGRVQAAGNVHLILLDGAELSVAGGIGVSEDGSLTIHACSTGDSMGQLRVYDVPEQCAGIGGNAESSNTTITIYGGRISAIGGDSGAGIGSGFSGYSTVNIYGGSIGALGGNNGAGIGSGVSSDSTVNIYGGSIDANGSVNGAGIGSGDNSDSTVNIYGGSIRGVSGAYGAGIGSVNSSSSTVTISGGNIAAIALFPSNSVGIGMGSGNSTGSVILQLSSENDSLGADSYYCGNNSDNCTVTVQDCVLTDNAGNIYSGKLSSDQLNAMAYKRLVLTRQYSAAIAEGIPEGMVSASSEQPYAGSTVTVSCPEGYRLDNLTVTDAAGNSVPVTDNTFIMPFSDVTVSAEYVRVYGVTVASGIENGSVTPDRLTAAAGETVTLTAEPAEGYALKSLTVTDAAGDTVPVTDCAFLMPAGNVTVSAAFSEHFTQEDENTWTIYSETGWEQFCDMLANNEKGIFTGRTVKLGASISVTRMAGNSGRDFTGVFDGQGNTLTFTATAAEHYCAPFRYVQGTSAENKAVIRNLHVRSFVNGNGFRHPAGLIAMQSGAVEVTGCRVEAQITDAVNSDASLYPSALVSQANNTSALTISGCTVTGSISTDGKYAGGIIGIIQKSAVIRNTVCGVEISSGTSGDGTHGGLAGFNNGGCTLTIEGCVFNGRLLGTATGNVGGFVGWNNGTTAISDSLFAPAQVTVQSDGGATFARGWNGAPANSYYTQTLGEVQGTAGRSVAAGEHVTVAASPNGDPLRVYDVSGITAYAKGIVCGGTLYCDSGEEIQLTLGHDELAEGFTIGAYKTDAGTLAGSENPYTLTLPDQDVTVSAILLDPADISVSGDAYILRTAAGWDVFCDLLANTPQGFFTGRTVALEKSITVTTMADGHSFTGTFDGRGHTLTLSYGTAGQPLTTQLIAAPFTQVSGQAAFRDLTVSGSICDSYVYKTSDPNTEEHFVGGLIGVLFGDVTIERCVSSVSITLSGCKGAGGFVGDCEHTAGFTDCVSSAVIRNPGGNSGGFVGWSRASGHEIHFTDCRFTGKLLRKNGSGESNGGFIGWTGSNKTVTITDCLYAPAAPADGETSADFNSATFARGWNGTPVNSYYTIPFGARQGTAVCLLALPENVTASGTTFSLDGEERYIEGTTVTLTVTPVPGQPYTLTAGCRSAGADGEPVNVSLEPEEGEGQDTWTFTMPADDVTVTCGTVPGAADFILPASLTALEESAFEGLTAMTAVDAQNCASIGKYAFRGCTGLLWIRLPQSCEIDPDAFAGCGTVYVLAPAGGSTEAACGNMDGLIFMEVQQERTDD